MNKIVINRLYNNVGKLRIWVSDKPFDELMENHRHVENLMQKVFDDTVLLHKETR